MATQPLIGQYVGRNLLETYYASGAPVAGTNEVQTLTIGGTPSAGATSTFRIAYDGLTTGAILWNATNGTLLAAIQAALDALPNLGTNWVVATAGSLTAGIGTILLTFSGGDVQKRAVTTMTIADNSLTGTAPTLAIAETTPGVDATLRFAPIGARYMDLATGILYAVTASNPPTLTKVGVQT